jgi:hypothetical protein
MLRDKQRKTNRTVEEIIDSFTSPVSDSDRARRLSANQDISIYDRKSSMLGNPFAGDTTVLDHSVDNTHENTPQTLDEIIDSVLHPNRRFHVKRSQTKLMPEAVSNEVREYWLQKIGQSRLNGAKSLYKNDKLCPDKV